ncbi:MAG TPA: hypothetical protein VK816_01345 [Jatrophihabitantaceae bacterium]|jgi:hypothetical protein|nr:hypothetical protein [Jatrophihabitantaceae bacterium]
MLRRLSASIPLHLPSTARSGPAPVQEMGFGISALSVTLDFSNYGTAVDLKLPPQNDVTSQQTCDLSDGGVACQ